MVANAGRLSAENKYRWSHVIDATGQGSQSSIALCSRFGFDPDERLGGTDEADDQADAEIEALRKEVARRVEGFADRAEQLEARSERLAEALREAYGQVRELCGAHAHPYPEASFDRYEAALHPTAAQENDDA